MLINSLVQYLFINRVCKCKNNKNTFDTVVINSTIFALPGI